MRAQHRERVLRLVALRRRKRGRGASAQRDRDAVLGIPLHVLRLTGRAAMIKEQLRELAPGYLAWLAGRGPEPLLRREVRRVVQELVREARELADEIDRRSAVH